MSLNQIASILAFLVGIMSIVAGGKAMQGWNPGYSVLSWLPVYNFMMGILAIIPAVLLWINHRYALAASVATLGIHTLVLLLLLSTFRGEVAFQSIAAMIFRLVMWVVILGLVFLQARSTLSST
ncbi:MAG: hypothetical protein QY328_13590 [Anaerolineales bacterium]|nr:MAG: hypothetical protein QY328_13590 [Anaerolineales bacterium]